MDSEQVEFVVVTNSFNRRPLLEKAADSLLICLSAFQNRVAWIVFDVGSTDGSREFIESLSKRCPQYKIELIAPTLAQRIKFCRRMQSKCRLWMYEVSKREVVLFL